MRLTHPLWDKYQKKWAAIIAEYLEASKEPTNNIDKYAVTVCKKENIVGHFPKGKTEIFANMIFYLLCKSDR